MSIAVRFPPSNVTREKFDAFGDKLRPRMEEAGIQLSAQPEVSEAHIVETF